MGKVIKEEKLNYVSGKLFGWGEQGTLRLTDEKLVWKGSKNNFDFQFNHISNVGVGKWGANNVLQITYRNNNYKFVNKDWTVVFFGVEPDRKYINIDNWIKKIDEVLLNVNNKNSTNESLIDALKLRLAKGEISIEEYEKLKEILK